MSQEPVRPEKISGLPHTTQIKKLVAEAKAADSEKGAKIYAADVAKFLVSARAGRGYMRKFSEQLALADISARHTGRGWVPESAVVRAFNGLMEQVGESPSKQIKTNVSAVHQLRLALYNTSSDLSAVISHHDECLPTEAVFLLWMLIFNNGNAGFPLPAFSPDQARQFQSSKLGYVMAVRARPGAKPDARSLMSAFMAAHSRSQIVSLYERTAQVIGLSRR